MIFCNGSVMVVTCARCCDFWRLLSLLRPVFSTDANSIQGLSACTLFSVVNKSTLACCYVVLRWARALLCGRPGCSRRDISSIRKHGYQYFGRLYWESTPKNWFIFRIKTCSSFADVAELVSTSVTSGFYVFFVRIVVIFLFIHLHNVDFPYLYSLALLGCNARHFVSQNIGRADVPVG